MGGCTYRVYCTSPGKELPKMLSRKEEAPWNRFFSVIWGILSIYTIKDFHILHAHLDEFKENMVAYKEDKANSSTRISKVQYNKNMMEVYIYIYMGLLCESLKKNAFRRGGKHGHLAARRFRVRVLDWMRNLHVYVWVSSR